MKYIFWVYLAILLCGLAVLAWPEQDNLMYIKLSETHGPSKLDLAGLVIIAMGYAPMIKEVFKKRSHIQERLGSNLMRSAVVLSLLSIGMIAAALYLGNEILLWISVGVSTLAQGLLVFKAFQAEPKEQV